MIHSVDELGRKKVEEGRKSEKSVKIGKNRQKSVTLETPFEVATRQSGTSVFRSNAPVVLILDLIIWVASP